LRRYHRIHPAGITPATGDRDIEPHPTQHRDLLIANPGGSQSEQPDDLSAQETDEHPQR
jgi:hypothetical protein